MNNIFELKTKKGDPMFTPAGLVLLVLLIPASIFGGKYVYESTYGGLNSKAERELSKLDFSLDQKSIYAESVATSGTMDMELQFYGAGYGISYNIGGYELGYFSGDGETGFGYSVLTDETETFYEIDEPLVNSSINKDVELIKSFFEIDYKRSNVAMAEENGVKAYLVESKDFSGARVFYVNEEGVIERLQVVYEADGQQEMYYIVLNNLTEGIEVDETVLDAEKVAVSAEDFSSIASTFIISSLVNSAVNDNLDSINEIINE